MDFAQTTHLDKTDLTPVQRIKQLETELREEKNRKHVYMTISGFIILTGDCKYCSSMYQAVHEQYKVRCSMTDGDDCYQNALAERINVFNHTTTKSSPG